MDKAAAGKLLVEVVYAPREAPTRIALEIEDGCTVLDAVERSGILKCVPPGSVTEGNVGIFGKVVGLATVLRNGDRVEIYRPLAVDPKEARRGRAARATRPTRRR